MPATPLLIATLWRTVWFREPGSPARLGRLDQVEHEALLTLLAAQAGVRTDEVVTAGATDDGNALLVLKRDGALLDDVPEAHLDDEQIHALWDSIGRMHDARIAHGRLDARSLIAADGSVIVVGFRGATVAASEAQLRTDDAQTLVTTALLADEERAVAIARERLGEDGLGATLPYVQPPALTATQRRNLRKQGIDLDVLRTAAAGAAGVEAPALLQLRRFSVGSIVRVLLPALALIVLISAAGRHRVGRGQGQPGLGLVVAGGDRCGLRPDASVHPVDVDARRLTRSRSRSGPLYALQLAVSYVNLAIPTSAARVAVNIRFFQRHGVPPGAAMAAGAMDGFSGFVVQATCSWRPAAVHPGLARPPARRRDERRGARGRVLALVDPAVGVAVVVVVAPRCAASSSTGRGASLPRPSKRARAPVAPPPRAALRRQPGHRAPLRVVAGHLRRPFGFHSGSPSCC